MMPDHTFTLRYPQRVEISENDALQDSKSSKSIALFPPSKLPPPPNSKQPQATLPPPQKTPQASTVSQLMSKSQMCMMPLA